MSNQQSSAGALANVAASSTTERGLRIFITASALDRVAACPASASLPAIYSPSEWADAGTARHEYLQRIAEGMSPEESLALVPDEHKETCEAIPLDRIPTHLASEVAFAYDVATRKVREIGRGINRQYNAGPTEICGTVDLLGVSEDSVYIDDLKGGYTYVPSPESNRQLLFGALCAARVNGVDQATVAITKLRDGEAIRMVAEVDGWTLDAFEAELIQNFAHTQETARLVQLGKTPNVTEGQHCTYCPAAASCPAKIALVRDMSEGHAFDEFFTGALTPSQAAEAYKRLRMAKALLAQIEKRIFGCAAETPVPLGEGVLLGKRDTTREYVDGNKAYEYLRESFGQEVADEATGRKCSKTALKAVYEHLVAKGQVKSKAEAERQVLADLRQRDAIESKTTTSIKEYVER